MIISLKKISGLYKSLPITGPCPLSIKKEHRYVYSKIYYFRTIKLNSFYRVLLFVAALTLWHLKAVVDIVKLLKLYSAKVRKTNNVTIFKQTRQLLVLALIKNAPPYLYYYLKLYNKQFIIADNYLTSNNFGPILGFLTKHKVQRAIVCDKFDFWLKLRPIISNQADIVAIVTKGKIEFMESYKDFIESDYFLKPYHGFHGKDCFRIRYLGNLLYKIEPAGLILNKTNLKKYLRGLSVRDDFILQPVLLNHPDVMVLSNESLVTSRIVSYLDKNDEIQVLFAQLYMPIEDSLTSNTNAICAAVAVETGILISNAINLSNPFKKIEYHPDGKGKIMGSILPFWDQSISICKKAHNEFRELPIIAWDVAFTPNGPILVEGNLGWSVEYWQLIHQDDYNANDFIAILEWHMKKMIVKDEGNMSRVNYQL